MQLELFEKFFFFNFTLSSIILLYYILYVTNILLSYRFLSSFFYRRPASIAIPNSRQLPQPLNPRMLHMQGSQMHERAASALSHSHLDAGAPSFHSGRPEFFPHLQVRGLEIPPSSRSKCFVQGVSFEVKGSEVLAIMSTSGEVINIIMAFVPCGIPINELLLILRLILKGHFEILSIQMMFTKNL